MQATDSPARECSRVSQTVDSDYQDLTESDIYTELQMRGIQCTGPFRTIHKSSSNWCNGTLVWKNEWTTFLEGMIHVHVLHNNVRRTQVPIKIRKIIINLKFHEENINQSYGKQ